MEFKTTTVKGLFDSGLQFTIPVYQRAYSWQKDNWTVFLEDIQNKGYKIGTAEIENEQIEHITPQTDPQEAIAAGYDVDENNQYSDDFREKFINSLGNLMLISGSHNASIGNKPFSDKLHSCNENPLLKSTGGVLNV